MADNCEVCPEVSEREATYLVADLLVPVNPPVMVCEKCIAEYIDNARIRLGRQSHCKIEKTSCNNPRYEINEL